ncbi:hypothetical protein ABZ547_20855 [Streptomyces sparsogenes]|uniref:hypothetical protein n=1 Tax=Streptomyces sparsogenes TaxID=67365 RepID=UPI00341055D4
MRRRRMLLAGGAAAVVLALLAGLLVWLASSDGDGGGDGRDSAAFQRNRKPFVEALVDLAAARGLHYKDTAAVGITDRDFTVTQSGAVFGSIGDGVEKLDRDVLRIGGKTYTRWKKGRDYEWADGERKDPDAPGRWTIGSPGESYTLDPVMAQYLPPTELAFKLFDALDQLGPEQLPDPSDPDLPSLTVGGVPALRADTSAGRIVVSKNKPYRVLRLEPYDLRQQIKDQLKPREEGEPTPTVAPRLTTGPLKDGDSEGMELAPVSEDQADTMYAALEKYAEQLKGAVDDGVDFTLDGSGKLDCGHSGCSVRQKFTGKLSTEAKTRITGGTVFATLSATISIDGQPAGGCTVPSRAFPVTGNGSVSGTLSCSAPEAGPVFAAADAKAKAQAEQQARASGGRATVRFYSRADTLVDARALAVGEVDRIVDQVRQERRDGTCAVGANAGVRPSAAQLTGGRSTHAYYVLASKKAPAPKASCFELTDLGGGKLKTPAGLVYGPMKGGEGHRIFHVGAHAGESVKKGKKEHSIFTGQSSPLELVDEAWRKRGAPEPNDPGAYVVPMGRTVGSGGQKRIRVIVKPGTTEVISAYPVE